MKKAVEYAKYKMWLPYKEFSKTGENPGKEPVWAGTVQKLIDEAHAEKAKAQKLLDGYKGSDKAKLQATLNENAKFVQNAQEYIYARWFGDDLLGKHDWDGAVKDALAGNLEDITDQGKKGEDYTSIEDLNNLYFDFDKEINAARKQIDKVWGADNRSVLKGYFTAPAYKQHAVKLKDAAWAVHFTEKAEWWLDNSEESENFLANAKNHLETAQKHLDKVEDSELKDLVVAYFDEITERVAELEVPAVKEVSAIEDIKITEGEKVELPEKVEVTYEDDTTEEVAVTWNADEFDFSKPGTYELTGTIEGTELTASVKVVVEAALPEVVEVSAITKTDVTVTLGAAPAAELTNADASKFEVKVGSEAVSVTGVAKVATDLTGKTYKLTVALDKKEGKVAVNGKESATFDFKGPEVATVTPLSDRILEVKFSEDVNQGLAQLQANYAIVESGTANLTGVSGIQVIDAKTVRVTTSAALTDGKSYTLTVNNQQDVSANKNTNVSSSKAFTAAKDTVKPTIVSAVAKDANKIEVTLSEELKSTAITAVVKPYNTDGTLGTQYAVDSVEISGKVATITLDTASLENNKQYNVALTGGADLSDNAIADNQNTNFTGVRDDIAPLVTGQEFKDGKLTINFSEAVNNLGTEGNFYVFRSATGLPVLVNTATPSEDNKSVTLEFTTPLVSATTYSVTLTGNTTTGIYDKAITPNALRDNSVIQFTTPAAAPTKVQLSGAAQPAEAAIDGKTVVLSFNTELVKAEAENVSNYSIASVADASKTLAVTKAVYNADARTVTLTTAAQEEGTNNYEVVVAGLSNLDAAYTKARFSGEDKVAPTLTGVNALNEKTVDLEFDQVIDGDQSGATIAIVEKGTANVITKDSVEEFEKKVRLGFDAGKLVNGKTYTITVTGVVDANGNTSAAKTYDFTVREDKTAAQLTGVTVVNEGKVVLQFNEELKAAGTIGNYAIKQGTTDVSLTDLEASLNPQDKTQVVIEGADGAVAFLENGKSYTVTVTGGVKDLNDNVIGTASYTFTGVKDVVKPQLVSATATEDNKVELTFSEELAAFGDETDYLITDVNTGLPLAIDSVGPVEDNAKKVLITLDGAKTELGKQYRVYIKDEAAISDKAVVANHLDTTKRAAVFNGVDTTKVTVTGATLLDASTLKVTFSEKVNAGTVSASDFVVNGGDVSSVTVSENGESATLKLATKLTSTSVDGITFDLKTGESIADPSGNKLEKGEDPLSEGLVIADEAAPTLVSYKITDTDKITLTFSESAKAIDAVTAGNTIASIAQVYGSVIESIDDVDGKVVITTTAAISGTPTIELKAGQTVITDAAGNKYAGNDIKVLVVDQQSVDQAEAVRAFNAEVERVAGLNLVEADYTVASWTELETAITFDVTGKTTAQINEATAAITSAQEALVTKYSVAVEAFNAEVERVAGLNLVEADYTVASWTELETALAFDVTGKTVTEVEEATTAITLAHAGLVTNLSVVEEQADLVTDLVISSPAQVELPTAANDVVVTFDAANGTVAAIADNGAVTPAAAGQTETLTLNVNFTLGTAEVTKSFDVTIDENGAVSVEPTATPVV
ncbi:Ig-like domain-containing protein [Cytobacillus firmus]|uniref:Ig-like domain-containing protein n=1 Tax=Cytobacillus firmus TaxID=1399 RepID=UPI002187D4F1|nr:Ig-like domain-containing protein [Cytobacillus firmus]URM33396.1 Ig-like domain-containing protein [Cytobacillus firmus]